MIQCETGWLEQNGNNSACLQRLGAFCVCSSYSCCYCMCFVCWSMARERQMRNGRRCLSFGRGGNHLTPVPIAQALPHLLCVSPLFAPTLCSLHTGWQQNTQATMGRKWTWFPITMTTTSEEQQPLSLRWRGEKGHPFSSKLRVRDVWIHFLPGSWLWIFLLADLHSLVSYLVKD